MAEKVSVIMPAHNGERFLAEAIGSVLAQTHQPIEIILVDDGSTDATALVVGEFEPRVRYCFQNNKGTAAARNRAVEIATGDLFTFLDQDDLWAPDKLDRQVRALRADPDLDLVFGHIKQFGGSRLSDIYKKNFYCPAEPVPGVLPSAMMARRNAFFRVGIFGETWRLGEWTDWYVRAVDLGLNMRVLPDVVAYRRLHDGNKGMLQRGSLNEYARILKTSLDRRRKEGGLASPVDGARGAQGK